MSTNNINNKPSPRLDRIPYEISHSQKDKLLSRSIKKEKEVFLNNYRRSPSYHNKNKENQQVIPSFDKNDKHNNVHNKSKDDALSTAVVDKETKFSNAYSNELTLAEKKESNTNPSLNNIAISSNITYEVPHLDLLKSQKRTSPISSSFKWSDSQTTSSRSDYVWHQTNLSPENKTHHFKSSKIFNF
mmetsp:Transcript_5843/g.5243  ORF Transcript_5843/g.5243 Transcript_5843/m.5243 type:complete len:187 (+) Transcript_5843:152-712(+)